ncbi:hypothetical protein XFF6992_50224 [Xanthomonas citri pv. fuscans]|nr:hypothetical protein XFF6992_50224 [Xanthomonas citri pv. fuscans]SOO34304.1 hypothetical protein XFF6994_380004 [Xanthomonas citri pv. fuscans]
MPMLDCLVADRLVRMHWRTVGRPPADTGSRRAVYHYELRLDGDRFARFVYVGRIVIAAHARRRGSATQPDNELIHKVRATGRPQLVCEVDVVPANSASLALQWRLALFRSAMRFWLMASSCSIWKNDFC